MTSASEAAALGHHGHASTHASSHATAAKAAPEEIFIVIEHAVAEAAAHSHTCKRIPLFLLAAALRALIAAHSAVHATKASVHAAHVLEGIATETITAEPSAEEFIIIVEEVGERILASEEVFEYLVCTLHVECC